MPDYIKTGGFLVVSGVLSWKSQDKTPGTATLLSLFSGKQDFKPCLAANAAKHRLNIRFPLNKLLITFLNIIDLNYHDFRIFS